MSFDMAVKAGRMAARLGRPLSACPYDPNAGGLEAALALGFVRGWRAAENRAEHATTLAQAEVTAKAADPGEGGGGGGGDPKGPAPPDQRWPGWAQDLAIAAAGTAAVAAAIAAALTIAGTTLQASLRALTAAWVKHVQAHTPPAGLNVPTSPVSARDWLNTTDLPHLIEQAITPPIHDMWMQGYLVGTRSAAAVYENVAGGGDPRDPAVRIEVDWGRWQPGDVAAARKIMADDGSIDGWLAMLRDHNVVIKGIADHRLDEIAAVLADGLEQGRSIDDIAAALNGVVGNAKRARNIAHTETARAIGAATLDSYVAMDVAASSWMTAFDQHVCPACWENEFESPGVVRVVPIGQRYPSGDYHPPAHPGGCRCTVVPVLVIDRSAP